MLYCISLIPGSHFHGLSPSSYTGVPSSVAADTRRQHMTSFFFVSHAGSLCTVHRMINCDMTGSFKPGLIRIFSPEWGKNYLFLLFSVRPPEHRPSRAPCPVSSTQETPSQRCRSTMCRQPFLAPSARRLLRRNLESIS